MSGIATVLKHGPVLAALLRRPRILLALTTSAALIGVNWLIYITAVNAGHIAEASLGYFINPLVNVLLGVAVLRERLGKAEVAAVLVAASGVVWLTVTQGRLPSTALLLAGTFGLYGLVRKMTPVEAVDGLFIETAVLSPLCLAWLWLAGSDTVGTAPGWPLVILSGVLTTVPLLMFAAATKRVRYSDMGLLQYIAPTLQLALAVFAFGEPLPPSRLLGFALIWLALAVYATGAIRRARSVAEAQ